MKFLPFFSSAFLSLSFVISAVDGAVSSSNSSNVAKEYTGIISRVNDAIITNEDLKEAVRLMELLMMTQPETSQRQKFIEEVLKEKINEQIKNQYLEKIASMQKIKWFSKKEIDATFDDVAKRYKMDAKAFEKFLANKNIKKSTVIKKIETDVAWVAYINARYRKDVNISDTEAKKAVIEIEEKMTQESFFVCRMFFPVDNKSDDKSVLSHANNILQMLKRGADFSSIARQFSKSGDAKNGGMLGWIFDGQLSDAEMKALREMSVGSYKIVRNDRGYALLLLRDKKAAGPRTYSDIKFKQVIYPFEKRPDTEGMKHLLEFISDMQKSSKNCHEFMKKAQESGVMGVSDEVAGTLENMIPEYRSVIASIRIGGMSEPIITDNGVIVVCLLSKDTKVLPIPTADEIRQRKINERLSALSERELRNLIKKASIVVKGNYSLGADYSTAKK
ncbi:MAG: peptidylprolyl isomerase [Alphaproteobacteria bacterium]|nr:peptidylprolyl isomerase [Alphaproteobacteria bacterium]